MEDFGRAIHPHRAWQSLQYILVGQWELWSEAGLKELKRGEPGVDNLVHRLPISRHDHR